MVRGDTDEGGEDGDRRLERHAYFDHAWGSLPPIQRAAVLPKLKQFARDYESGMSVSDLRSFYDYKPVSSDAACKRQKAKQFDAQRMTRGYLWKSPGSRRSYLIHIFHKTAPQQSDRNIRTVCGRLPLSEVTTGGRKYVEDLGR